jgi:hypothetical protein
MIGEDDKLATPNLLLDNVCCVLRCVAVKVPQRLIVYENMQWLRRDKPEEKDLLLTAGELSQFTIGPRQHLLNLGWLGQNRRMSAEREISEMADLDVEDIRKSLWQIGDFG